MSVVSVIGACGHVGFPFSVVIANAGHKVWGIDINDDVCEKMNLGFAPHIEYGINNYFSDALNNKTLSYTINKEKICESDVTAIMIGTPIDDEGNPKHDDILNFIEDDLCDRLKREHLIILRSTVSPGTTEIIKNIIEKKTNYKEGIDFYLVFCPERVMQGYSIIETPTLPQLIGAFTEISYLKAKDFFKTFLRSDTFWLFPREAEIGKLITNMYRYVTFALANEFYIIADKQGVDIHKVIDAVNKNYNRMALPKPGPNVSGPCLYKDGKFLLTDIPFADLINTSFNINEGMPDYVFNRIKAINPNIKNIFLLGLTFKAGCDDTRNSLSYKFKKVCKKNDVTVLAIDPFVANEYKEYNVKDYDAIVIMTPHNEFKDLFKKLKSKINKNTLIVDIWKLLDESKLSYNGIYCLHDIENLSAETKKMYKMWGYT